MKKSILVLLLVVTAFSCGDKNTNEKDETLMKEVVAVHDELMTQMGKLTSLEMTLELASADGNQATKDKLAKVRATNTEMFDWMRDFGADFSFEEINKGQELTVQKQQLLQSYHERIVLLQDDFNVLLSDQE